MQVARPEQRFRRERRQVVALDHVGRIDDRVPVAAVLFGFARKLSQATTDGRRFITNDVLIVNHVRRDVCFDCSPAEREERDGEQQAGGQLALLSDGRRAPEQCRSQDDGEGCDVVDDEDFVVNRL